MTDCELREICSHFALNSDFASGYPYGEGHINDTYHITLLDGTQYILQGINTQIFKQPQDVMNNIALVTDYLHKAIAAQNGDPYRETMTLIPAKNSEKYIRTENGNVFRMFCFIDRAVCYQSIENPRIFYQAAKAFGKFQKMLADFPAEQLKDTIENFHDTYNYFKKFEQAVKEDRMGRCDEVTDEIQFVLNRINDMQVVSNAIANNKIPLRVTHNDTKLNNVMFDKDTNQAICVIDLDTVMPGSLLADFGDAIRFGANTAAEDETDLSKVSLDLELFEAFTKGFLKELADSITPKELELLAFSAKLLTLECGIRFLTDYLVGDTYFKIKKPKHNLYRARTQLKLVEDIEKKLPLMNQIVQKTYAIFQ